MGAMKAMSTAVRSYVNKHLSEEVRLLISEAVFDLHYGPRAGDVGEMDSSYPGFVKACRIIRAALDELGPLYWCDWAEEVMAGSEAIDDEAVRLDEATVRRAVCGSLASYL